MTHQFENVEEFVVLVRVVPELRSLHRIFIQEVCTGYRVSGIHRVGYVGRDRDRQSPSKSRMAYSAVHRDRTWDIVMRQNSKELRRSNSVPREGHLARRRKYLTQISVPAT